MQRFAIVCLVGCGGAATAPAPHAPAPHLVHAHDVDRAPVDPIAALLPSDDAETSSVLPGPIELELGGAAVEPVGPGGPIEVTIIDEQGNLVRVAAKLDHVRFSVWTERARLLAVLARDQRIEQRDYAPPQIGSDIEVALRAGARVKKLAHKEHQTQIRYLGALQVEGWVPDDALADRARSRDPIGRIPTGRKTLMVIPGAVIRTEPQWSGHELAIVANGYFLDTVHELDEAWTEVSYEDGEVVVHGYVSKRDPPGRVHRWHDHDSSQAPVTVTPNATAASGTCLYSRPSGESIGYIVGNRPVQLDDAGNGWWTLTVDTPWGPVGFSAQGPMKTELVACAPPGSVPPVTPPPSP